MVEGEYQRAFAIMKLNEDYADQKNITLEMVLHICMNIYIFFKILQHIME